MKEVTYHLKGTPITFKYGGITCQAQYMMEQFSFGCSSP